METEIITNQNGEPTSVVLDSTTRGAIEKAYTLEIKTDLENLENLQKIISIVPKYYEFQNKFETLRAIFMGVDSVVMNDRANPGEKRAVKTAFFLNKEGSLICSSVSLVKHFELYGERGKPYEIIFLGEEVTSSKNKVKTFEIYLLG
jgi:hypothetical protein